MVNENLMGQCSFRASPKQHWQEVVTMSLLEAQWEEVGAVKTVKLRSALCDTAAKIYEVGCILAGAGVGADVPEGGASVSRGHAVRLIVHA